MRRLNVTTLLAAVEATYGTDVVPTTANAVLLRGKPTLTPLDMTVVQRDLLRPYLGNGDILPGSIFGKLSFEVEAAGSGTAGTAPPLGALLRSCAVSQNINAAAITGTAQAGGSATTIKLAAAASAVNDFYTGLPISITAGTGIGNSPGVIVDYDGTTKIATVSAKIWTAPDATSTYAIAAGVVYRPVSGNFDSVSLYFNLDGVLHKFLGARGNAVLDFTNQKIPFFKFDLEGVFQPVIDAATPAAILTAWKTPLVCTPANNQLFDFHENYTLHLESLSFDFGVATQRLALINSTQQVQIDQRAPSFKVSLLADTMAARNWFDRCASGASGDLVLQHGTVAGNKLVLSAKSSRLSNPQYGAIGNVATLGMDGAVLPVSGNDEFALYFG